MILGDSLIVLLCASVAWATSVSDTCAAKGSDGVLLPAVNCNQYYMCSQGAPLMLNCQADLVFNIAGYCDWPNNVNCDNRSVPEVEEAQSAEAAEKPDNETPATPEEVQTPSDAAQICAAEGSDGVLVPAENCAQFYKCSEGLPVILDCQAGLLYNPSGWCDWPQNVNCADRSVPDVEEEAKSEEAAEKPDESPAASEEVQAPADAVKTCAAEGSDGLLVPAENCAQFYKCSEGLPVIFDCQAGLLYNPGGWCDWPENVNCGTRAYVQ